jgi:uncharacterized protein YndB with AHSA1/START domain/class 3 adenylate cyclase
MTSEIEHGYLVLADISGYTSYLAGVELEHAHEILTDLLEVIVDRFKRMLTISKLEGDAVFANVSNAQLPRPEALLELIEDTYLAFRRRRDSSQRRTTCDCRACQSMPTLDLKFFIHQGDYIVQDISGIRELVGSDVNIIHRLTKNHIADATGWKAYALLTQNALDGMNLGLEGLHEQVEAYEHLGEFKTFSMDMHSRYDKLVESQHMIISPEDADLVLTHDFNASLSTVWQFFTDPAILTQTMREDGHWSVVARPGGRAGVGARNHCAHGKGLMVYTYLDWRPFEYYTAEAVEGKQTHWEMYLIESISDGKQTRLTVRIKISAPLPKWLKRMITVRIAKQDFIDFFERSQELMSRFKDSEHEIPRVESVAV